MNYTNITYDQLLSDFKDRLSSDPQFANLSSASIYQMFMEMLCACMDMTNYYMQRTAEEAFIDTAKLDSSVIKHGKNLGYNPRRPVPAKCELQIELKGPLPKQLDAGDKIVFNQDVTDLVYNNKHFILDNSYEYTFTSDDFIGKESSTWSKILTYSVPSENVTYLPLQGKNLYNRKNLKKITCFQGESKVETIMGNANLNKIGKVGQFYDINDLSFSNWYSFRDPYGYFKDEYVPKLSWTKVGIGKTEDEALADDNLYQIEDVSVYLNKDVQKLENVPAKSLKICVLDTNWDKTVRLKFGNDNLMTSPGLTTANTNIYVKYLSTEGAAANTVGTTGSMMTCNSSFYLQHAGEIIDVTNNVRFIINSDIYGGEDFETKENIKINAPGYFSSRNKLVTKQDFVSYFRGLSKPLNVQTALVFGQQEIEDEDLNIYQYLQNYVIYSLIGHMYYKTSGNYVVRNVLTGKDVITDPFSVYGEEYLDHISDYVKMMMSFKGFYNLQYDDEPNEQWLKNLKLIRDNCQSRMELNSRILSIPPFVHYYDLVGKVRVKPLTKLQDYKTSIENKIYEYLDNRNGEDQKIYKSDLIKFFTDHDDTLSASIDLRVSDIIRSTALSFTWENGKATKRVSTFGNCEVSRDLSLPSASYYRYNPDEIEKTVGKNWWNKIRIDKTDLYNSDVTPDSIAGKRIIVKFINSYMINGQEKIEDKPETFIVKIDTAELSNNGINLCPYTINAFKNNYVQTIQIILEIPKEEDFYSKSSFSIYKTDEYKLSSNAIINVENMMNTWINNGTVVTEADRAIPLPYNVYTNETVTREETFKRVGNIVNKYENTLSEKSFWMYFIPNVIKKVYGTKIDVNSDINNDYWKAASILIFDLYCLIKPGLSDSILDANNNITNFTMSNEVAIVRCNLTYSYESVG